MEEMARTARDLGVDYVFFGALTLDEGGKRIFFDILRRHFPEKLAKYQKLYASGNIPKREYTRWLYGRAVSICRKYGVKLGITGKI